MAPFLYILPYEYVGNSFLPTASSTIGCISNDSVSVNSGEYIEKLSVSPISFPAFSGCISPTHVSSILNSVLANLHISSLTTLRSTIAKSFVSLSNFKFFCVIVLVPN